MDQVISALERLFLRLNRNSFKVHPHANDWPSPCEQPPSSDLIWQPTKQLPPFHFADLETALNLQLHSDFQALYGHYYCASLSLWYQGKLPITLLLPWNHEDLTHALENQIGHLTMLKKLERTPTLFIASTNQELGLLALDNQSGTVIFEWLESGKRIEITRDLATFIDRLNP